MRIVKPKCPRHTHREFEDLRDDLRKQQKQLDYLLKREKKIHVDIYSAGDLISMGRDKNWHRIVCEYDGDKCLGGPRPHWHSIWGFDEKGFSLESFVDGQWRGWKGPYAEGNELKYDQLDQKILHQHHQRMVDYIKNDLGIWYPCHLWDDINGTLHRP